MTVVVVVVSVFAQVSNANLVVNGSFEDSTVIPESPTWQDWTEPFGDVPTDAVSNWTLGESVAGQNGHLVRLGGSESGGVGGGHGDIIIQIAQLGTISQEISGFTDDMYTMSIYAACRVTQPSYQNPLSIMLDDTIITWEGAETLTPATNPTLLLYTSDPFSVTSGSHTLSITGTIPYIGTPESDRMAFIDDVSIDPVGQNPLPGDLNSDGFVGGDDLDIVRSFWGQNVTPGDLLSGDPSEDGFVGGDDLDIVRANWGQGTPPAPSAIPEPASVILLVTVGLMALGWIRHRGL